MCALNSIRRISGNKCRILYICLYDERHSLVIFVRSPELIESTTVCIIHRMEESSSSSLLSSYSIYFSFFNTEFGGNYVHRFWVKSSFCVAAAAATAAVVFDAGLAPERCVLFSIHFVLFFCRCCSSLFFRKKKKRFQGGDYCSCRF